MTLVTITKTSGYYRKTFLRRSTRLIYKHSKITSIDPYIVERSSYDISSLVFMDDSTLISSSKKGMEKLLSITEEFYYLNNTAANHSKYVLISNSLMNIDPVTFNLDTSVLNYRPSITINPLKKSESFRFLGCWFNMDHKPNFVQEQITSEYNRFI